MTPELLLLGLLLLVLAMVGAIGDRYDERADARRRNR